MRHLTLMMNPHNLPNLLRLPPMQSRMPMLMLSTDQTTK